MVPSPVRRCRNEPTGAARVRFEKRWWGIAAIIEGEFSVEYRRVPGGAPERTANEWERVRIWNYLGRWFYTSSRPTAQRND